MSTETVNSAGHNTSPVPGCAMCDQMFDPDRKVVYDTEHFVGYVSPVYPWAVMLTTRRHDCDGPWSLTEAEATDLGKMIPRMTDAIRKAGSEGAYVMVFGEDIPMPHFHLGFFARHQPIAQAEQTAIRKRMETEGANAAEIATKFAAEVRAQL